MVNCSAAGIMLCGVHWDNQSSIQLRGGGEAGWSFPTNTPASPLKIFKLGRFYLLDCIRFNFRRPKIVLGGHPFRSPRQHINSKFNVCTQYKLLLCFLIFSAHNYAHNCTVDDCCIQFVCTCKSVVSHILMNIVGIGSDNTFDDTKRYHNMPTILWYPYYGAHIMVPILWVLIVWWLYNGAHIMHGDHIMVPIL